MAESFAEKRKRELGITGKKDGEMSFAERRKIELGMTPAKKVDAPTNLVLTDTLKSVMKPVAGEKKTVDFKAAQTAAKKEETVKPTVKETQGVDFKAAQSQDKPKTLQGALPAASLLTGSLHSTVQSTLKNKVPASSALIDTGDGPSNASQIPGISQYEINKQEIDKAPPVVKQYAQVMNYLTEGNPIGVAVGNAFSGNSGVTRKDSSGNAVVDKISDTINKFVTPVLTPTGAPLGQGTIGASYDATGKLLSGAAGNKLTNLVASSLPFSKGGAAAQNIARVGLTEGIAGSMQGAGLGMQEGQTTGKEILNNAGYGAVGGSLLGGFGTAAGEGFGAILSRFRKSGLSDAEIAEIAPELLALPEANPRTVRKQQAGEINGLASNNNPIADPYTFKLDQASPKTVSKTANAAEGRTAVSEIDSSINDLNSSYEQAVIDEYKGLKEQRDNPKGVNQGGLYFDTEGAVTGRQGRLSNNPRWYQEAMKENNYQKLSNKKLYEIARKHIDEGFETEAGRAPSWKQENGYDEQLQALTQARETLSNSVREIDPAINVTDSPIAVKKLKDTRINGETSPYKEPVIREPQTLSREQEIINKGKNLSQEDIDFAMSDQWDNSKLLPESVPTESTYVKPTLKPVEPTPIKTEIKPKIKAKSSVESEVAATAELQPANKTAIVTDVKKPNSNIPHKPKTEGIRSNYKTIEESGNISPELKARVQEIPDKKYNVFTDVEANRIANEHVKDLASAETKFMGNEYKGKESITTGYRVAQELDKLANATKDVELQNSLFSRSIAVLDKVAKDLTEAGQAAQAGSLIEKMSPEGQLRSFVRKAEAKGFTVTEADKIKFKKEANTRFESGGAGVRENELLDSLDRLSKDTATKEDILKVQQLMDKANEKLGIKPKNTVKDKLPKELDDVRTRDKVVSFLEAQEAAAQARINKRHGRLNSTPVGEWIDYSILIAAKVGKGIIKAETHIEDIVKLFGEDLRPVATQIFQKAQELVGSVTKGTLEGDFIKADNAFKRITGKSSMNPQERLVEKYLAANPEVVSPKDIEAIRNLSKSMTDLQGTDKIKADMAMQKIMNSYTKSSPWNKMQALRYISMLLNDATQTINAISGPVMASYYATVNVLHTMIDIGLHATLKTPRNATLYGTNPIRFLAEWGKHAKIGGGAGWHGVNPAGIENIHEVRGLAFKNLKNPLTVIPSLMERSLGAVAKGADYATYGAVYQAELKKAAYLDAINSGIKRSNKAEIENHVRRFINDPPLEAVERADRRGKSTTFQLSDSLGGKTANWLNAAPGPIKPIVTSVLPFVRTPLNISSTAFSATPGGILKGLIQLSSKSKASQYEAIRTLSMGITGVGMSATGFYLANIGIVTGANDTGNKDVNSINDQAGRAKFRFNTSASLRYVKALLNGEGADAAEKAAKYQKGDKQFDYNKLQPLAAPIALGAGYEEAKGSALNKSLEAGKQSYNSLFGMTSLKGVQDVFQPQYTGSQSDKSIKVPMRIVESYIKSFSPSFLAQEARREDPIQRKTAFNETLKTDISTYYKSRIPGLSKSLPPMKDTLGNTKLYPKGIVGQHLNPYKSEVANYSTAAEFIADLIVKTGDQSIAPSAPAKNFTRDGVKVDIPLKRYQKMQEDVGQEITKRIIEIDSGTDEEIIQQIKDIYSEVKEEYMDEVKDELD